MGIRTRRLNAQFLARVVESGLYPDGEGLFLQVRSARSKSWVLRFSLNNRTREMGLGSVRNVTLAEARQRAAEARKQRADGIDPIAAKRAERARNAAADASTVTFEEAARRYVTAKRPEWRSVKHSLQWDAALRRYAFPLIGKLPVQLVDVGMILKILEPIWLTKSETAGRVRGRIEAILDWAKVRGYREGENPARWRGHLEHQLAKPSKAKHIIHHPALAHAEIGVFMQELRTRDGIAAAALEFLILTATRTGEVLGARWSEFDFSKNIWTIPADRMKAGRAHRIPLSPAASAVIERMRKIATGEHIFFGIKSGRPLSNMALLVLLRRMGRGNVTSHGFRSTFRDWVADRTNFPREVAEAALAHKVSDAVEAAYARTDFFEKRRRLMEMWADHCAQPPVSADETNVTPIRA
jgi:integrase